MTTTDAHTEAAKAQRDADRAAWTARTAYRAGRYAIARREQRAAAALAAAARTLAANACPHRGHVIERTAHGYLGDAPAGTTQRLCADCGAELSR